MIEGDAPPMREDEVEVALFVRGLPPVLREFQARVLDCCGQGALQDPQAQFKVLGVGAPSPR
jgi:hypothetical protein